MFKIGSIFILKWLKGLLKEGPLDLKLFVIFMWFVPRLEQFLVLLEIEEFL